MYFVCGLLILQSSTATLFSFLSKIVVVAVPLVAAHGFDTVTVRPRHVCLTSYPHVHFSCPSRIFAAYIPRYSCALDRASWPTTRFRGHLATLSRDRSTQGARSTFVRCCRTVMGQTPSVRGLQQSKQYTALSVDGCSCMQACRPKQTSSSLSLAVFERA